MNMGHLCNWWFTYYSKHVVFFVITLKYQRVPWEIAGAKVPIVEHFNCWLAGFHRDNQGLTAGGVSKWTPTCHCVHPTKTLKPLNLWSIVSGLVRVFLLSRVYPLTTWNIECINEGSLSEPHTATPLILKPFQPILHAMPPEQTLICYWNVLDLCTICLWMFVSIYFFARDGILWQAASLRSLWP